MITKTTEDYIAEAKLVHGDKFDYSKTVYTNNKAFITVIDKSTGEEFSIQATNHLKGDGKPKRVFKQLARTCSICGQLMSTPSKDDLSGFIEHGEKNHPNYFLGSPTRYEWIEKKYYNPITEKWYGSRKYLARSIKECGMTNEQYYLAYGEQYMPEEWNVNTNDPKFGDAPNTPYCLETGDPVKFDEGHWCYPVFINLSASTSWHAKNTDRIERAQQTIKEKLEEDNTFMLRPNQIDYWIVKYGMTRDEASKKVSERQTTNSLDAFIKRCDGNVEEGTRKWTERQEKWLQTLEKNGWFGNCSKVSKDLFSKLEIAFPDIIYGDKEANIRLGDKVVKPDCIDLTTKTIIEFYGDYWHANPKKFESTDAVRRRDVGGYILADEIWNKDKKRIELMEQHGYKVLIVWEHDYKTNPDDVILNCIQHLQG